MELPAQDGASTEERLARRDAVQETVESVQVTAIGRPRLAGEAQDHGLASAEDDGIFAVRDPDGGTIALGQFVQASGRWCFRESPRSSGCLAEFYYAHGGRMVILDAGDITLGGELAPFWHDDERLWRLRPRA